MAAESDTAVRPDLLGHALVAVFVGGMLGGMLALPYAGRIARHVPVIAGLSAAPEPPPASAPPPVVEPLELKPVAPTDAVAINDAVPFTTRPVPAARPFLFAGGPADRARATDCLAAAQLFEAGAGDDDGQRAVAQVVLNRVRHPAYPKSVCGVVFQGSERRTGCQFTFTCDGALARLQSGAAWDKARAIAAEMLSGHVYAPVGWSTHYHTNWVVPYWSASLDKVTAVRTHLFFRWNGWWGTPGAFRGNGSGVEQAMWKLKNLSPAHAGAVPPALLPDGSLPLDPLAPVTPGAGGAVDAAVPASKPAGLMQTGDTFILTLDPKASGNSYAALAKATCGDRPYCKVMGWLTRDDTPKALPAPPDQADRMAFSYLRMRDAQFEKSLWDCRKFPRADTNQCIRGTAGGAPRGTITIRRRPGLAGEAAAPASGTETVTFRRRPGTGNAAPPEVVNTSPAPQKAP